MAFENRGLCLGRTLSTIILLFCICRYVAFLTYKDLAKLHFDLVYSSILTTFDMYVSECSFCCLTYGCSLPRSVCDFSRFLKINQLLFTSSKNIDPSQSYGWLKVSAHIDTAKLVVKDARGLRPLCQHLIYPFCYILNKCN